MSASPALPEGSNVLELGCGDGKTLAGMPDGWLSYALDFSLPALRLSRSLSLAARLILADACRLPFLDSVFDAVFAFHVTGHLLLPGRRALAAEAARVLVPGDPASSSGSLPPAIYGTERASKWSPGRF